MVICTFCLSDHIPTTTNPFAAYVLSHHVLCPPRLFPNQVATLMAKSGIHFEPGLHPGIKPCCLNLDPLNFIHRPLISYLTIFAFQLMGRALLLFFGFER